MTKRILTRFAVCSVFLGLLLAGCKDFWHPEGAEDDNNNSNNSNNNNAQSDNPFKGNWSSPVSGSGTYYLVLTDSYYTLYFEMSETHGMAGKDVTEEAGGSYTYSGSTAVFSGPMSGTANLEGGTLFVTVNGMIQTFTKFSGTIPGVNNQNPDPGGKGLIRVVNNVDSLSSGMWVTVKTNTGTAVDSGSVTGEREFEVDAGRYMVEARVSSGYSAFASSSIFDVAADQTIIVTVSGSSSAYSTITVNW